MGLFSKKKKPEPAAVPPPGPTRAATIAAGPAPVPKAAPAPAPAPAPATKLESIQDIGTNSRIILEAPALADIPGIKVMAPPPPEASGPLEIPTGSTPPPAPTPAPAPEPAAAAPPASPPAGPPAPQTPSGLQPQILPVRAFRVAVSTIHRVHFVPTEPILKGRDDARLSNISTSGVGLAAGDFSVKLKLKQIIEGSLVFEDGSYPVKLQIMHVTSGVIGARFDGETKGLSEAIKKYFELELLALGMLKVNPAHHKAEADGNAHWIHGDQCELFYVTDAKDQVIRLRLTFLGNRFVWSKQTGLNVGQVIDDRVGIMRTDRIAVMEATPEIIDLAVRFLLNIPQIPLEHRQQVAKAIAPNHELAPAA